MGMDKYKAIHHSFRIPERVLLTLSFLGGSIGSLLGMILFHHKTKKKLFIFLNPFFLILHILLFLDISKIIIL